MGQRLSLLAPSAPTVAISSYIDAIENYQYIEILNNSRFLKTIKAIDKTTGQLVIIKLLIKPSTPNYTIQLQNVLELLVKQSSILYPYKNILTGYKLIETDRAGYMIREMAKINLYDRLSLRPFLEPIEKLSITFQLLKIINELHSVNIHHGDLRLENILVTSWNWILLSDFASLIKPTYLPEDNPNQFLFYFDSSDRRVCYIAPERFYNRQDNPKNVSNINDDGTFNLKNSVTDEMDLFSLGCVIAELWTDGEPIFTLSQLFKYMKNDYVPDLSSIQNPKIIEIIKKLLKVNPSDRSNARELLEEYKGSCFPEYFYTFLYEFMENFNTHDDSDSKLQYVYEHFGEISNSLKFNYAESKEVDSILPIRLNLPTMPHNYRIKPKKETDDSALVVLNMVTSLLKTLRFVESKQKFCVLVLALSEQINDEAKLDRSLPFLCSLLDEYIESPHESSAKVVCLALYSITSLVMSCSYITPINVLLFPEYILPKINNLLIVKSNYQSQILISSTIALCLPSLATVAKKFWSMSKAFTNTNVSSTTQIPIPTIQLTKDQLDQKFKDITISLLTDPESSVKISLLENILPLCQFFGKDKTNDIILPHLISYLNDPDANLRLAFLSSVLKIGPFIGVLSFEQYLLPLLIQTISEGEQFVVIKVLEIFNAFVSQKLINSKLEFNALEIYTELLSNSIYLLLHPNEWIRQSVINLIISISQNLDDADRYCFLYPLIKSFLQYDIFEINWTSLYPSLAKQLNKQIFDLAITWALKSTNKSLFWQGKSNTKAISLNTMGKSVYLPKVSSVSYKNKETSPLSPEDKQWLLKLKSIGFEDKSLWKIFVLRDYIQHVSKIPPSPSSSFESIIIPPKNEFLDIIYKSEKMTSLNGSKNEQFVIKSEDSVSLRSLEKLHNSLVLPSLEKVTASVQTIEANVFGEMESSNGTVPARSWANNPHTLRKTFKIDNTNSKIITCQFTHTYVGKNPFIIKHLQNLSFTPTLNDFAEFGRIVKAKLIEFTPQLQDLNIHRTSEEIDPYTCLSMSPTSELFVTGSENGMLRLWDISKLNTISRSKNSEQLLKLNSRITTITFLQNRLCIIVTTRDGILRVFRIDVSRNKNRKIVKYLKPVLIRQIFNESILTNVSNNDNYIFAIDYQSKINVFDLITLDKLFVLQNPLSYGVITSFITGNNKNSWILIATKEGILTLWDLRFKILLKSYQIQIDSNGHKSIINEINSMEVIEKQTNKLLSSKDNENQLISIKINKLSMTLIFEVSTLECKKIIQNENIQNYKCKLIEIDKRHLKIEEIIDNLNLESI